MAGISDRPPAPPAGWFADPAGSPYLRWWDGAGWTDNFIDARTGAPPAELAPARAPRGAIAASTASAAGATEQPGATEPAHLPEAVSEPIALPAAAPPSEAAPVSTDGAPDSPPLTRREARARERAAEEARATATVAPREVPAQPEQAVEAEPLIESEPLDVSAGADRWGTGGESEFESELDSVEADDLLAHPVSAATAVESLGDASEPDAVVAPEQAPGVEPVPSIGAMGIPLPDWATGQQPAASSTPALADSAAPTGVPLPGTVAPPPSFADVLTGPQTTIRGEQSALGTANAWSSAPAPSPSDAFPLALNDTPTYTPMETRRPAAVTAAELPDARVTTWAVWVYAALPVVHLALAWLVFGVLSPADTSILRWVVLFSPIILYLLFAGLDRWTLLRGGQVSVAPVAYAIVPPLYLAIRVVRMGVRALPPLLVWIVLNAAVVAVLVFLLPDVLRVLRGS